MSGLCQSHEAPQASAETLLLRPPAARYLTLGAGRAAPRRRGPVPTSALLKGAHHLPALGLLRGPSAHGQQFSPRVLCGLYYENDKDALVGFGALSLELHFLW